MFQVIFNAVSVAEMSALPKELQLEILADFQLLPADLENLDASRFGKVRRDGRTLYRCRAGDYRIYFEPHAEGILVQRVLHKNTIRDFLFRSNLPMDEDEQVAASGSFWKMIEEGDSRR
ncbi:MAG: type II toxin-antitoxin system RelE/ParE family toxin [Terrimicrobiaceae bacterium]|nr:type II toxin-antitoxin system RelE/ParE family toxin [Terrimicrobiaceae bacterium]